MKILLLICFVGVMCPTLPDFPNGGVSWTGLDPGENATYTCDPGYILVGLPTRVCGDNGTWNGDEPSCRLAPSMLSTLQLS